MLCLINDSVCTPRLGWIYKVKFLSLGVIDGGSQCGVSILVGYNYTYMEVVDLSKLYCWQNDLMDQGRFGHESIDILGSSPPIHEMFLVVESNLSRCFEADLWLPCSLWKIRSFCRSLLSSGMIGKVAPSVNILINCVQCGWCSSNSCRCDGCLNSDP